MSSMEPSSVDVAETKEKAQAAVQRSLSAVTYCCGACGYDLRLRSSDRNTAGIVGGYGRAALRRGVVAFDAIDDARFGHADEFRCVDVRARRLFVRRTRLLCRKCGASLGFAYDNRSADGESPRRPRYDIRIRKLQPLARAVGCLTPPLGSPSMPSSTLLCLPCALLCRFHFFNLFWLLFSSWRVLQVAVAGVFVRKSLACISRNVQIADAVIFFSSFVFALYNFLKQKKKETALLILTSCWVVEPTS